MKRTLVATVALLLFCPAVQAAEYKPIELHPDYEHDEWGMAPQDIVQHFRAYTVSFDGDDDDNRDGMADKWAIPHWVAYQIKKFGSSLPPPSSSTTDRNTARSSWSRWTTTSSISAQRHLPARVHRIPTPLHPDVGGSDRARAHGVA